MGSSNATQRTTNNDKIKDEIMSKRVKQIKEMSENYRKNQNDDDLNEMLPNTMQVAEEQIKRKGRNLTKTDLITIIIALEPHRANKMYQLNSLKIEDLNFIIRAIIYNPQRYTTTYETPSAPPIEAVRIIEDENVQVVQVDRKF